MDKKNWHLLQGIGHCYFLMILGAFCLFGSIELGFDQFNCERSSVHLQGKIIRLERTANTQTYPIASYQIKSGKTREFRFDDASDAYSEGDNVPLMVGSPPHCSVEIDKGIWNFSLAMQTFCLGLFASIIGIQRLPMWKKAWKERAK